VLALCAAGALALTACSDDDDDAADAATSGGAATTAAGGATATTAGGAAAPAAPGETLQSVLDAGTVRCGTRDDLPGFATLDSAGDHVGFDADFCRVIAAAVLGDATAVEFVDLETANRFTALQSGEIDVLVRNTTWTATRDGTEGATFLQPTFYDGQGMMVAADAGISSLEDLAGQVVCVAGGTTTEGNVATEFARLGVAAPEVLSFDAVDVLQTAFQEGRCDGWSSDRSQLTGLRSNYPDGPDSLVILPGPSATATRSGRRSWSGRCSPPSRPRSSASPRPTSSR
jgi:general L-amino acid transport system substrate-binding protein